MARFDLIGSSYPSQSPNADAQRTINWYMEAIESGVGQSGKALYPTPGTKLFCTLTNMTNVRAFSYIFGRLFVVAETLSNQYLFEVFADKTFTNRATLGAAGAQATMAANNASPAQLMITSAGRLFLFNLGTNAISEIDTTTKSALQGPVSIIEFTDSYFVALLANSQKFQLSALLDGSSWDPADIFQVSLYTDNITSMRVDHREIWLLGPKQTVVYGDTGDLLNPFQPISGAYIEQGIASVSPPVKLDNSIFWIGVDERGTGIAWRANGYQPQRISNHAVEYQWSTYSTIADLDSYAYQDQGHAFWVLRFPSANGGKGATWVYDVATGQWHERSYYDGGAHRSRCHAFAFNQHLVGDWATGNIYQMSIQFYDDAGKPIIRERRSPHISIEQQYMYHTQLQVDLEVGLGPQPPLLSGGPVPRARGPQLMLSWSDDGGHTWSNEYMLDCGQAGKYRQRVIQRRLGRTRDRVYKIKASDPVPWRIIDAYLQAIPGYGPTERLVHQAGKSA